MSKLANQITLPADTVLKVDNLSKKFCRTLKRSMYYGMIDTARSMFGLPYDTSQLRKCEFWALENINFELKKGETLGIIGENGSGKSTLLRLITGIFPPDAGKISFRGRIGALIAVGAGFHPHMTGRENIYLNGTILGMTKKEIDAKYDEIVDFADIGEFLEAPVNTYSSGMRVRLGFAIAVHCEPDILLVDEVLSVGDLNFKSKCIKKMGEIRKKVSIIFISHDMFQVDGLCHRCILMNKGKIYSEGETHKVIQDYYCLSNKKSSQKQRDTVIISKIDDIEDVDVVFLDQNRKKKETFLTGENIQIKFKIVVRKDINDVDLHLGITSMEGVNLIVTKTLMSIGKINLKKGTNNLSCYIKEIPLLKGVYNVHFNLREDFSNRLLTAIAPRLNISLIDENFYNSGIIKINSKWKF